MAVWSCESIKLPKCIPFWQFYRNFILSPIFRAFRGAHLKVDAAWGLGSGVNFLLKCRRLSVYLTHSLFGPALRRFGAVIFGQLDSIYSIVLEGYLLPDISGGS